MDVGASDARRHDGLPGPLSVSLLCVARSLTVSRASATVCTTVGSWLVKNSWSTKFANNGFIKVARGLSCASIDCCGNVFTLGEPASYYEADAAPAALETPLS